VRRHVLLEIEVSERISIRELEELAELGVRKNNAAILLVLKTVCADVGSHLLGDISSRHKSAMLLAEEISKLVGNLGWLDEATGSAISLILILLRVKLVKDLKLLSDMLLDRAKLGLDQRNRSRKIVKGLVHANKQIRKRGLAHKRGDDILDRCLNHNWNRCGRLNGLRGRNLRH